MLRKSMIALCAVASIAMLTPDLALARGGGGGGGGGHGGGGGGGGRGAGGFGGGGGFGARGLSSGGNFGASFARAAPVGAAAVQGGRFANGGFNHGRFDHGFRGRHFFAGGFGGYYDGYWDYPDYAYDDSYYDNGGCYVVQRRVHTAYGWRVRPVQVCG
jgi:hypothetical protein